MIVTVTVIIPCLHSFAHKKGPNIQAHHDALPSHFLELVDKVGYQRFMASSLRRYTDHMYISIDGLLGQLCGGLGEGKPCLCW